MSEPTKEEYEREAAACVDRALSRLRDLHEYAGRGSWDKVIAEELLNSFAALRIAAETVGRKEAVGWQPIETASGAIDGLGEKWIGPRVFGKMREWGWECWIGQLDSGDIWLGRSGDGACFVTDAPTHWQPLPLAPVDPQ